MFVKAVSKSFKLLLIISLLSQLSELLASPASLSNFKINLLLYDYKDSSAIHESQGTPTKWLFESDDITRINKEHYLSLAELEGGLSPKVRKEFEDRKLEINKDYRVKIVLWEKALPKSTKVKSTKLIPLYPKIANNLKILDTEEIDRNDINFVKVLSSTPLIDFIQKGILDINLPTSIEEPHLYFLGVYITKSDEIPDVNGNNRSVSYWFNTNPLKIEKDLTKYLEDNSKVKDLRLFVVATDYLDLLTTKSFKEEKNREEQALVESLRRALKPSSQDRNRMVVFFIKNESGEIVKTLEVQTGDIAVRLGTDINIAAGLGPIPATFENDTLGIFNWDVTKEALEKLFLAGLSPELTVEEMFISTVKSELPLPFSNSFANYAGNSLLTELDRDARGSVKTIDINNFNFDNDDSNDPQIKYFNRLDPDHPSPYLLTLGEFINVELLRERLHYYPGTIFFSHTGIISVEENKKGGKEVWVYDAYPKTKQFPNGIRRVPFAEMFGENHGSYGAILRLREDLALWEENKITPYDVAQRAAVEARLKLIESLIFNPENKVYFDYEFDWQNEDLLGCSEFVWKLFGEGALKLGAKLNLVPNLSMLRIPTQFAKQIGQNVKLLLQISPQDLATSPFVTRIADFDSKMIDNEIQLFSATKEAQDMTEIYNLSNPKTGHKIIHIY